MPIKLSILIPVYNERAVVEKSLTQVLAAPLPENLERELVIVDDCSKDGTSEILARFAAAHPEISLYRHEVNQGKGAAVRTAIEKATGDFCLIQDADLEYDPSEYPVLMAPLLSGRADAVFGSRYLAGEQRRVLPFWHSMINLVLTLISNMFSNLHLTDMETCYKVFRTDLLKSIPVRSDRFGFEPEITMKCAKRKFRIYEVPISYHGRTYEEGKKIGWRDGVKALGVVLYFWVVDDLYKESYGRSHLNTLTGTPAYLNWLVSIVRPFQGDRVLELGAGLGSLSGMLMGKRLRYVAGEKDPLHLHSLRNRFLRTPNVEVRELSPDSDEGFERLGGDFDTVLLLRTLEYSADPEACIGRVARLLPPGGRLIISVPQGAGKLTALDAGMGYRQRFTRERVVEMIARAGFEVEEARELNKIGKLAWGVFGGLGSSQINKLSLKLFDQTVWLWKLVDRVLPWRGLNLIVIARKR
ncbi:glycosyltransferase [Bryobacter aggregatus]|uniref:glycosyltransferase n=1 Tax=Bryobacter aggregatus TaxID=360054 RepID=UPI001EE24F20|nr:glycosyltransferase [Bryobacter aggregatus]